MNKKYSMALGIIAVSFFGSISTKVASAQDTYSVNTKGCGISSRYPRGNTAIEIPVKKLEPGGWIMVGQTAYKCTIVSGGNCRDNSTAICWDPKRIIPNPATPLEGGIRENIPTNTDGGTPGGKNPVFIDPTTGKPTNTNPYQRGNTNQNQNSGTYRVAISFTYKKQPVFGNIDLRYDRTDHNTEHKEVKIDDRLVTNQYGQRVWIPSFFKKITFTIVRGKRGDSIYVSKLYDVSNAEYTVNEYKPVKRSQ